MTVDEIFKILATHMVKGCKTHEELANYYDFLSLKGFRACHEHQYIEESCGYRKLCRYYMKHYKKLIQPDKVQEVKLIPSSWYGHERQDVDIILKRESAKTGFETWINWQKETKNLYENMYSELIALNQIATAMFLKKYICDVTKEIEKAEKEYIKYTDLDFRIEFLIQDQKKLYHKYKI